MPALSGYKIHLGDLPAHITEGNVRDRLRNDLEALDLSHCYFAVTDVHVTRTANSGIGHCLSHGMHARIRFRVRRAPASAQCPERQCVVCGVCVCVCVTS